MEDVVPHYAVVKEVSSSFADTVTNIRAALAQQGFGILCEIDVAATLKKKLDVDHPNTLILGACNPPLAHRAMSAVPDISVLLPCNVVIRENQQGKVEVAMINPITMSSMIDHPEIAAVAGEADQRLRKALAAVS